MRSKRKRGGQPGNRNARKHGFFSAAMTPAELGEFWQNLKSGSGDRELAFFRTKLNSALRAAPGNRRILEEASRLLAGWYCSRYGLLGRDRTDARKLIRQAFAEAGRQFPGTNRISLPGTASRITKRIEAQTPCSSPGAASKGKSVKSAFLPDESVKVSLSLAPLKNLPLPLPKEWGRGMDSSASYAIMNTWGNSR